MKPLLLLLALSIYPTSASAEDRLFRISLVAAMAAHGADLASTENCLGAGRCRELNPFLARFDQPAVFGAAKIGVAALSLWGLAKLHETHPKLATISSFAMAGAFAGIAVHNAKVSR